MLDRIVGTRRPTDGNGHIAVEAGLVTDATQLASSPPTPWHTPQLARKIARPRLGVPVVVVVLGEGGSGGALALGVGDVVLALENATYSVISPEGCAAILWRSASEAERAAVAMKLAGPDLLETGVADALIREPAGGAHTDHDATAAAIKTALIAQLDRLSRVPVADLLSLRYERVPAVRAFVEPSGGTAPAPPRPWWRRILRNPLPKDAL